MENPTTFHQSFLCLRTLSGSIKEIETVRSFYPNARKLKIKYEIQKSITGTCFLYYFFSVLCNPFKELFLLCLARG